MIISSPPTYVASPFIINRLNDNDRSMFLRLLIVSGKYEEIKNKPNKTTIFWPTNAQLKKYLLNNKINQHEIFNEVYSAREVVDNYILPYSIDARWFTSCAHYIGKIINKSSHIYAFDQNSQTLKFNNEVANLSYVSPIGRMADDNTSCEEKLIQHEWLYIYDLY